MRYSKWPKGGWWLIIQVPILMILRYGSCVCVRKVGPSGIRPGLSKLTAIVDRKTPANFKAFSLEFTGYFHTLVKG